MSWSDHVDVEDLMDEIDAMSDGEFVGLLYRAGFTVKDPDTDEELSKEQLLERFEELSAEDLQRPGADS